jgi:hypothetical protein
MLHLENGELRLDLLDPVADAARLGARYCAGGYVWQVHDRRLGPLLAGPEWPSPTPSAFNGQGLPESFRHRSRSGTPFTWAGEQGLAIGAGTLTPGGRENGTLAAPCAWTITPAADHIVFQTRQAHAGFACELTRKITLAGRTVHSHTQLTNVAEAPLALEWFPHPFWALSDGRARLALPAGTTVPENPGFTIDAAGTLTFRRPFRTKDDNQFALLTLPAGQPLSLAVDHPNLKRVTFAVSYAPSECPVWANAHTASVEPYLSLRLAPGETRHWHARHGFEG